ncbi:hypothetical protein COM97_03600 [Bacillus thuringiensis]|nr:hypothetical protein COM97_03600 [Bacillus thuringiensis]
MKIAVYQRLRIRICNSASFCIRYPGVYVDDKGNFFYQTEFGIDRITGKRIRKKEEKTLMEEEKN